MSCKTNYSSFTSSTMSYSWIHCFFVLASMSAVFSSTSSFQIADPYTQHCSSVVDPHSNTVLPSSTSRRNSPPSLSTSYFTGGHRLLMTKPGRTHYSLQKSFGLRILPVYDENITAAVYKVEGFITIRFPYSSGDAPRTRRNRARVSSVRFPMEGFWSEISRKLCMFGSAPLMGSDREAVLKLKFDDVNPTMYSGVVSGSFESTASANAQSYFDPILIFSFPPLISNYSYSLVSKEVVSSGSDARKDESVSLGASEFCSVIERGLRNLELEYEAECIDLGCSRFLSLSSIQCLEREGKARFLAAFHNYTYEDFALASTLIGEASWDDQNNRMIGVACEIFDPSQHFGNAVGDCSTWLSLRYSSVITIRNNAKIHGQIWSSKHYSKINLTSTNENRAVALPEVKYEYTEMDRVRKFCPLKNTTKKGNVYPDGHSYDMRFYMNIKNGKGEQLAWAAAEPSWVGNDSYQGEDVHLAVDSDSVQISYNIRLRPFYHVNSSNISSPALNWPMNPSASSRVEITAEGLYDAKNGYLCMVGCRKLVVNSSYSFKDCEVAIRMELPPLNRGRGSFLKGTMRSTRATTDPLHFYDLIMQSATYYVEEAKRSIWRMDLEIAMVLVSNTLVCIFVGMQLFHVKRHPEVTSSISLVMIAVLCVGHSIPLVLNFEAVLLGKHDKNTLELGSGGRVEANEVAVRVITMVALLLQLRLLQLVWTAKGSWKEEKKAGVVSLSLYILGGMLALLLRWIRNRAYSSVWGDLRSYAGLILDGFLVPQILLNILSGSAEKALSYPFYIGTSVVRLVPHAYDQFRSHSYPKYDLKATYYYANPVADFYSTAWDIMIPFVVVALAVIVFLQQRYGRCIPQRFKALEMYLKVPATDNL